MVFPLFHAEFSDSVSTPQQGASGTAGLDHMSFAGGSSLLGCLMGECLTRSRETVAQFKYFKHLEKVLVCRWPTAVTD